MGSPVPVPPPAVRPLPVEVPPSVRERVNVILSDPKVIDKAVAFVLTPTLTSNANGVDVSVRMAVMVNVGGGFSFAGFTDWKPLKKDLALGAEIRFVR